eukprot:TRINITY_DN207_c0_g2_i4.p1 TRINITY_DN207_c0_g2~~TRINITY_DN207_c0_g2_i4.p1  ORF type:complete len:779 (-),score=141.92 TRINITY_DN207_c0_g2_i4:202-2538(-)
MEKFRKPPSRGWSSQTLASVQSIGGLVFSRNQRGITCESLSGIQNNTCKLTVELPKYLLRGVPLQRALEGFGRHWSSIKVQASDGEIAQEVETLSNFISHDWRSSRFSKLLALCVEFNARLALVTTILVFSLLSILRGIFDVNTWILRSEMPLFEEVISPGTMGCTSAEVETFSLVFGMLFFSALVLFWQSIRSRLFRLPNKDYVFLDKLCIDQEDVEAKQLGIYGLAAFIRHSERMLVLWTPRYFTRLWCTYELVAWTYLQEDIGSSILFLPVNLVTGCVGLCVCQWLLLLVWHITMPLNLDLPRTVAWFVGLKAALLVYVVHEFRKIMKEAGGLPSLLQKFSIRDAECFCCANDHKDPISGAALQCDRSLVYKTLKNWYIMSLEHAAKVRGNHRPSTVPHTTETQMDMALDIFDEDVRTSLLPLVCENLFFGGVRMRYRYAVCCALPVFLRGCDVIPAVLLCNANVEMAVAYALDYLITFLCVVPLFGSTALGLAALIPSGRPGSLCDILAAALCWVVVLVAGVALYVPGQILATYGSIPAQLVWFFILAVATTLVYRPDAFRTCWRRLSGLCRKPVQLEAPTSSRESFRCVNSNETAVTDYGHQSTQNSKASGQSEASVGGSSNAASSSRRSCFARLTFCTTVDLLEWIDNEDLDDDVALAKRESDSSDVSGPKGRRSTIFRPSVHPSEVLGTISEGTEISQSASRRSNSHRGKGGSVSYNQGPEKMSSTEEEEEEEEEEEVQKPTSAQSHNLLQDALPFFDAPKRVGSITLFAL